MNDSAGGSFGQLHAGALAACEDYSSCRQLAGFRVEFGEFCTILKNRQFSLSLLLLLVYLNLVRIRLLQYFSTNEILS